MPKLTTKTRDQVEVLLNTYSALCQSESKVGKRDISFSVNLCNEKNDSDFVSVSIDDAIAKAAIQQQKKIVAASLAKHGIQV